MSVPEDLETALTMFDSLPDEKKGRIIFATLWELQNQVNEVDKLVVLIGDGLKILFEGIVEKRKTE